MLAKPAAIDRAILECDDKSAAGLFLDIILKKKGDIEVRAGCHLTSARAAGPHDRKRPPISESGLLLCRPPGYRPKENGGPCGDDVQAVVQIRRENESVVPGNEPTVFLSLRGGWRWRFPERGLGGAGWIGGGFHWDCFQDYESMSSAPMKRLPPRIGK